MKLFLAVGMCALPLCLLPCPSPAPAGDGLPGQAVFNQRCANCHHVGDTAVRRDQIWTALIRTST